MAKILYLVPGIGLNDQEIARRQGSANEFLTNRDNRVVVDAVDEGPLSIESSVEEHMAIGGILKKVVQIQDEYDAIIIGCAGDPGLAPARELARIPVIGPIEASLHTAASLADNFTVITVLDTIVPAIWRMVRDYGLENRCASVRVVNSPVLALLENKEAVTETFLGEVKAAVSEDRAASIIMGCMTMAFLRMEEPLNEQITVPVINPAKVSIKYAEMIVSLGLRQSRVSYPQPDYDKLMGSVFRAGK
jgi:allantoin racemase